MWTDITRPKYLRDGLRYASDTTTQEWAVIAPLLPPPHEGRGRPRTTDLRAVMNAIFYIAQTGCQWRMLPRIFHPTRRCSGTFTRGAIPGYGSKSTTCC